jgi:hypothetical protein
MIGRGDNESNYFQEQMNNYTSCIWFPVSERKSSVIQAKCVTPLEFYLRINERETSAKFWLSALM